MADKIIDIEQLAQDGHNFNKGNEQGQQLMERSFKELGAGRSILLDRNGNIIAGNKSQKAAIAAGIKKVRVIETTGDIVDFYRKKCERFEQRVEDAENQTKEGPQ